MFYEIKSLARSESFIKLKSELNLFIDNGLWRCGVRMQNADLLHCAKNLLNLPRDNYFIECPYSELFWSNTEYLSIFSPNARKNGPEKLRIQTLFPQCNGKCKTFNNIRSEYSIPNGSATVRKIIR